MAQTRFTIAADKPELDALSDALDPHFEELGWPSALFEVVQDSGDWAYTIYVPNEEVGAARALIADQASKHDFDEQPVEELDWIAETLRELAPVHAGRFVVHGSHDRHMARSAAVAVEVDAGQAFGTGHHGTTAGCLDMLETVLRRDMDSGRITHAIDVGAGSGVLAIALARAARIPVLATDIDPVAEIVARENAKGNGVGSLVECVTATGFNHRAFGRYDDAPVIFANILARPLEGLARPLAAHLAPGGSAILSGLLPHQKTRIVAAYRGQGLVFERALIRDGWLTLLMRRPHSRAGWQGRHMSSRRPANAAIMQRPGGTDWSS